MITNQNGISFSKIFNTTMKKQLLILLITILSFNCYSQISFEKGYYINNSDQKIDCLIKNVDWKNNPSEIEYKLREDSEQLKLSVTDIKEFVINNKFKFVSYTVNIDRSTNNVYNLSEVKNPIFNEEQLFLKAIIEGKANLYLYEDGSLRRYFYSKDNAAVEQLIFKNYKTLESKIGENNAFKQQIFSNLKCQNISLKDVENLDYKLSDLNSFFIKYNECSGSEFINFEKKEKRDLFNVSIRPGLNSSSLSISNNLNSTTDTDFGNKLWLRLGVEIEFIMPFNKNKWAFIIEPSYQHYTSEKTITINHFDYIIPQYINLSTDYESIELPIGIRHYLFLNDKSKFFMNGSVVFDFTGKSNIDVGLSPAPLEINTGINLAFGVGYKYNDKYSFEFRYMPDRDIFYNYSYWRSDYDTFSFIVGYTLF